jgi:hypothetical protein
MIDDPIDDLAAEGEWVPGEAHKKRACVSYAKQLGKVLLLRVGLPILMFLFLAVWTGPDLLERKAWRFCARLSRAEYVADGSGVNASVATLAALNSRYDESEAIGADAKIWYGLVYGSLSCLCLLYAGSSIFICRPLCARADLDRAQESEIERSRQRLYCISRTCRSLQLLATVVVISAFVLIFGTLSAIGVGLTFRGRGSVSIGDVTDSSAARCSTDQIEGYIMLAVLLAFYVILYTIFVCLLVFHPNSRTRFLRVVTEMRSAFQGYAAAFEEADGLVSTVDMMRSVTLSGHTGAHANLMGTYRRDGFRNGWATFAMEADPASGHGGARLMRTVDVESIDVWRQWVVVPSATLELQPIFVTLEVGEDAASPATMVRGGVLTRLSWREFVPKCPRPFKSCGASWPNANLDVTSPAFPHDDHPEGGEMEMRGGVPIAVALPVATTLDMSDYDDGDDDMDDGEGGGLHTVNLSMHSSAV